MLLYAGWSETKKSYVADFLAREYQLDKAGHAAVLAADGDKTVQTSVVDIARKRDWPEPNKIRVLNNDLVRRWRNREDEMREVQDEEAARYEEAARKGDTNNYGVIVGENVGLMGAIEPAAAVLEHMVAQAEALLRGAPSFSTEANP